MNALARLQMTYEEYLVAETASEVKHEYLRGEVWAMSGGTIEHAALAMAFGRVLGNALLGRPCRVYSADARVRVLATDRSTYPDLSVVCGKVETAPDDRHAIVNPVVLVEVLSRDTEADDRGAKFAHYRHLASLHEYVLVAQDAPRIEVFRLDGDHWSLYEYRAGAMVRLTSLNCQLSVDEIYRDPLASGPG